MYMYVYVYYICVRVHVCVYASHRFGRTVGDNSLYIRVSCVCVYKTRESSRAIYIYIYPSFDYTPFLFVYILRIRHLTGEFLRRHSSKWRLTDLGRQQAEIAGEWLRKAYYHTFVCIYIFIFMYIYI